MCARDGLPAPIHSQGDFVGIKVAEEVGGRGNHKGNERAVGSTEIFAGEDQDQGQSSEQNRGFQAFILRSLQRSPYWMWNSNHRPERVKPAFEASRDRLGLKYLDLYLMHTPFAFRPGDDQDPRDQNGNIIYDRGVTLLDTWTAMENLVNDGTCRAIGLSDIGLNELKPIYESARIKPAVVQVESHPYLPETELLEFCKEKGIVFLAFAPLGHGMTPGPLEDPVISAIAARVGRTPAQVLLAWAVQRGTALLTTPRTAARAERISTSLPFRKTRLTKSIVFRPGRG